MTVRQRELDARIAWALLCGARTPEEPNEPITVDVAELRAQWAVFRGELLQYWETAVESPDPGWPDPVAAGPCWAELVFEQGVDDETARRRVDDLMGWSPAGSDGDALGG